MNIHLKQRLVGALVLIAAAAVFLPMLFEAPKKILIERQSQIPQASPFKKFQLVEPASRTSVAEHKTPGQPVRDIKLAQTTKVAKQAKSVNKPTSKPKAKASTASKTASADSAKPKLDKQGLPVAWVIQVASFVKKENAVKLKDELRGKNFSAYTKRIDTSQGPAVRVFVGPKLDKKRAAQVKQRLDKELKLNTLIVRFEM